MATELTQSNLNDIEDAIKKSTEALTQGCKNEQEKEDAFKKMSANRARSSKLAAQAAADREELSKKNRLTDGNGKEISRWARIIDEANQAINSPQAAYNDWRHAITSLWAMLSILNEAIACSLAQLRGEITITGKMFLMQQAFLPVGDYLLSKIKGCPDIDLPSLHHLVHFKDGAVQIEKLRINGTKIDPEYAQRLDSSFNILVKIWLTNNGYIQDATHSYVDAKDDPLNNEKFDNLNNGITSLESFLNRQAPALKYQKRDEEVAQEENRAQSSFSP